MMATASRGKWGCGSLWATLPAPAQPPEDPQAYSPPLPRLLAGLTARIPSASAPTQRRARPTPAPASRAPHVALGLDPWASPGGGAGLTSQSEPLRSAVPPNQRLRGYWLRPLCDPSWLLLVALPPRSCPDSLSSVPRHSSAPRGRPSFSTRSARPRNDHAVPLLYTQMAKDLVARIPSPGGD